ncbi:MAG: tetratricopeptide repeat-containing sensor histidine kinase [Pelobium sp.]
MKNTISKNIYLVLISILFFIVSCKEAVKENNVDFENSIATIDSLISNGEELKAKNLLRKIDFNKYDDSSPKIANYYLLSAKLNATNLSLIRSYADSALNVFKDEKAIQLDTDLYFKTLIFNGEAYFNSKNYLTSLNFFLEAKKYTANDNCKDGYLATNFAFIYFNQKNYQTAIRYWKEANALFKSCQNKTSYTSAEMVLNNIALAYFKDGKLDSAQIYYNKYNDAINIAEKSKKIDSKQIILLRCVLYDNLGGLYMQLGDLKLAEDYLKKGLNLPIENTTGIRIPIYLKLAKLYIIQKNNESAQNALQQSKFILNKFRAQNAESEIEFYKQYASYFNLKNQLDSAYFYNYRYVFVKDSINQANININKLDVSRELEVIAQRQSLTNLQHNKKLTQVYVVGLIELIVLVLIIIVIVYLNLKKSKMLHKDSLKQNEQLKKTLVELEKANKNYIRIMRVMAHDLRNPISGMTGLASLLLDEDHIDVESKKMLNLIQRTGLRSVEMISELLKTGLSNDDEHIEVQKLDLKALLFDAVELLQFKAKEKQQTIIFENKDNNDPLFANVNYEKIWRVLNNLLVNAIKFSLIGGVIKTGIQEYKASIVIYIKDNGIGIPEENKDLVFDMFTSAKKVGTNGEQPFGLGLSISKKIMEKHRGKIWFENGENGGTTFYLEFIKPQ